MLLWSKQAREKNKKKHGIAVASYCGQVTLNVPIASILIFGTEMLNVTRKFAHS